MKASSSRLLSVTKVSLEGGKDVCYCFFDTNICDLSIIEYIMIVCDVHVKTSNVRRPNADTFSYGHVLCRRYESEPSLTHASVDPETQL